MEDHDQAATYKSFSAVTAANDDDGGAITEKKRIIKLETQLAESLSYQNKESSELHCQIANLLNQLETGEAERQQLESNLHHSQQESFRTLQEKEKEWREQKESLQSHLSMLSVQCQQWRRTLETVQQERAKEKLENKQLLEIKEKQFTLKCVELDEANELKDQLQFELANKQSESSGLEQRLHVLEEELKGRQRSIQQRDSDLSAFSQREKEVCQQLQNAMQKVDSLERTLSKERTLLQELQFKYDLIQHHEKDWKVVLEREKSCHHDYLEKVRELERTVSSLKSNLTGEGRRCDALREQLQERTDKCQSLEEQCREKQASISDLSHRVHLLQASSVALREKLNVALQKLSLTEDTHFRSLREANSLITQFESRLLIMKEQTGHDGGDSNSSHKPSHFLDKLRSFLTSFQSSFDNLEMKFRAVESELISSKEEVEGMRSECKSYREALSAKSLQLHDSEEHVKKNDRELSWHRTNLSKLEAKFLNLEHEVKSCRGEEEQDKSLLKKAREDITSMEKKLAREDDIHCQFLRKLHKEIIAVDHNPYVGVFRSNSWTEMSKVVKSSVTKLAKSYKEAREEIKECKLVLKKQQSLLESAADMHEEAVSKLNVEESEKEKQWEQRLTEIKRHYELLLIEKDGGVDRNRLHLLEELQAQVNMQSSELQKLKHIHTQLKEQNHQLENLRGEKNQLEEANSTLNSQLTQLKEIHKTYKNDRACLLSCVCLMVSTLLPSISRVQQLSFQKHILLNLWRKAKEKSTSENNLQLHTNSKVVCVGVKRTMNRRKQSFRIAVIVAIAANRLVKLRNEGLQFLSLNKMYAISLPSASSHKSPRSQSFASTISDQDIALWLRNEQVLYDVRNHLSGLQTTLDLCTKKHLSSSRKYSSSEKESMKSLVIDCHHKFLKRVLTHYNVHHDFSVFDISIQHNSLWYKLGLGLETSLNPMIT